MAHRESTTPSSALELFLDAFDGMPIQGCHELRLSPQELAELTGLFPSAVFHPLEELTDGKRWYEVSIALTA